MPGIVRGTVRYNEPDLSVRPEDRGLFSGPAHKSGEDVDVDLYDPTDDPRIIQSPDGLDVQGFTYVKHKSSLGIEDWLEGNNVEEKYVPEVEALVRQVTGCKTVVVNHLGIRKRLAANNNDPTFYRKAGDKHDEAVKKLTGQDKPWVNGRKDAGLEPARFAHCDYTLRGMKRTARYCRKDITEAAQEALDAEDRMGSNGVSNGDSNGHSNAVSNGHGDSHPKRYAAYSVWRPIRPVKRDPLAVADWRTTDPSTLCPIEYRATSNITESGEYMLEQLTQTPEAKNSGQRWYCKPNQQPDDVLILKFADTATEWDKSLSAGCAHCSPVVHGTESEEEPRMSVEARVMAFW